MNRADADDGRIQWVNIARDNALQRRHNRTAHKDGINSLVRHGTMTAASIDAHRHRIGRSQKRTGQEPEFAHGHSRHIMQCEYGIAGKLCQ
jgi:hypothetical protein